MELLFFFQNVFKVIHTLVFNQGTKSVNFKLFYQAAYFSLSRK